MQNLRCTLTLLLSLSTSCATSNVLPSGTEPSPSTAGEAPVLRLGSTRWAPFTDAQDKPHVAFDLVSRALTRAGYMMSTTLVPDGSLNEALHEGRFDGSAALWRSPEREQFLLYSKPYFENRLMLVGKKGEPVDAQSLDALKGKRIGVVEGYAYGEELETKRDIELVRGASSEDNLRALLAGEVDYVIADDLVIHHLLSSYPGQLKPRLAVGNQPLLKRTLHLTIQKSRPDAQRIIAAFNQALSGMVRDGSYNELLEIDWIRADIDGDGTPELVAAGDRLGTEPPKDPYDLVTSGSRVGVGPVDNPAAARFIVKGVAYDSWSAVPDEHKTETDDLSAKPRTLRVEAFKF